MNKSQPWLKRNDLRLAVITGLAAGFGELSSIPYGYYLPLTTAAVLSDSYGSSLKIGKERLLGSLLGVVLLVIFSRSIHLPMPLAMGMALASIRLVGGVLGLEVGYKIGGIIIVMGWLVHQGNQLMWGPERLFWTALGIVISLWSCRWIWPSQARPILHRRFNDLLTTIENNLSFEAERLQRSEPPELTISIRRERRQTLLTKIQATRLQRVDAQLELGVNPEDHHLHRLWSRLDLLCSELIGSIDGLRGLPAPIQNPIKLSELHHQEAKVMLASSTFIDELASQLSKIEATQQLTLNTFSFNALRQSLAESQVKLEEVLNEMDDSFFDSFGERLTRLISLRAMLTIEISSFIIDFSDLYSSDQTIQRSLKQTS